MGNIVFVAIFFGFLLLGGFTFATTLGMVTLAVAAVAVLDTLRLFMDAVGVSTMDLLDGRYFVVADLVFALVFSFFLFSFMPWVSHQT